MTKAHAGASVSPAGFSLSDLRDLGRGEVSYVRKYLMKGEQAFVLHAADGTALAVQRDLDSAHLSARSQELEVVAVH